MIRHTGKTVWDVDAPSEKPSSSAGSKSDTPSASLPCSPDSPLPAAQALERLAAAMEEQNRALWALVHQTAALISMALENGAEDDDESGTYLDGSPRHPPRAT
jgi:hypothetical protein